MKAMKNFIYVSLYEYIHLQPISIVIATVITVSGADVMFRYASPVAVGGNAWFR
jgi:hypothetical protein